MNRNSRRRFAHDGVVGLADVLASVSFKSPFRAAHAKEPPATP